MLPPTAQQPQTTHNAPQKFTDPRSIQPRHRPHTTPSTDAPYQPVKTSENNIRRPQRGGLIRALTQGSQNPRNLAPQPTSTVPVIDRPRESLETATQNSLYGYLDDDVNIPKPLTAEDLNTPINEPIPTASSVPVIPVDREEFSGLLGG